MSCGVSQKIEWKRLYKPGLGHLTVTRNADKGDLAPASERERERAILAAKSQSAQVICFGNIKTSKVQLSEYFSIFG